MFPASPNLTTQVSSMWSCEWFEGLIMNGSYILLLILLKTFLVPLPNDLIRLGVPGTINSVLSMAEFNAAFELFMDFQNLMKFKLGMIGIND